MRKRYCPPGTIPYIIRPGDNFSSIARQFKISAADLRIYNYAMDHNFLIPGETLCVPVNIYRPPYNMARPPMHRPHAPNGAHNPGARPSAPKPPAKPPTQNNPSSPQRPPSYQKPGIAPEPFAVPASAIPVSENTVLPFTDTSEQSDLRAFDENARPYVIQKGDTLANIAKKHKVFLHDLLDSNPALNPELYKSGQTIFIPGGMPKGNNTYSIVRGDTLRRIAEKTRFSTKIIRMYNPNVNWSHLRIGQKIYIPRV